MNCPFCSEQHDHCDSPGAIVTRTTGCPTWDNAGKTAEQIQAEERKRELRRKVDELLGAGAEL